MSTMDDTRKAEDEQDPTPDKDTNPLLDPANPIECVVVTGSEHHSARPGPGRLYFSHPDR